MARELYKAPPTSIAENRPSNRLPDHRSIDPPPGTSATTATSAQSHVRSTALARPRLGPAHVSAAAEDDRAGGGELLSDQLAQLIVT